MTTPVSSERPPSLWEDLLEIFYAPRAVFERRRETPAFGLALLVLVILLAGLGWAFRDAMEPVINAEFNRNIAAVMKKNPQITPEMLSGIKAASLKWLPVNIAVLFVFLPLVLGLTGWLVGKFLESKAELGQVMMVAVYACFPRVIETILNAVQGLLLPEEGITSRYSITLSLARVVPTSDNMLMALLGRIDLFTLWVTFILAVGMEVMGRMPRGRAWLAAGIMWVLGALPTLGGLLMQGG